MPLGTVFGHNAVRSGERILARPRELANFKGLRDRWGDWLGDLDSNQSYRSQSPGFYR